MRRYRKGYSMTDLTAFPNEAHFRKLELMDHTAAALSKRTFN